MSVNIIDPNYLTFKSNALSSCFGSMTFKPNCTEDHNPFSSIPINIGDSTLSKQTLTQIKAMASQNSSTLYHNSFLKVAMHLLYNISAYKRFFNLKSFNTDDPKSKLLCEIKAVFNQYDTRREFFIDHLHYLLSKLFKKESKFSMTEPDNPIDCYFIMINCLHNYSIKLDLSNVTDQQCYSCFSHANFYMDILRKEQCECGWNRSESLSSLNYIMNIPIDDIFKLAQNSNLVEMNKTCKFKAINFCSNDKDSSANDKDASIQKMSGKMFFYLSNLLNNNTSKNILCGKCKNNYINKSLLLNNLPACLSFSLSNSNMLSFDINEILYSFILIPKIFELGQLFDNSSNNKIFYDFCGIVMINKSMTYSVAVKHPDTTWKYVNNDSVVYCQSWFELIGLCLKDMGMPILVLYQIQEKYSNKEKDLDSEDIRALERYVCSIEGFKLNNPFRIAEGIMQTEPLSSVMTKGKNDKRSFDTNINTDNSGCINKNHSSKTSTCNSTTSKNSSIVKGDDVNKYSCLYCGLQNRIENVQCLSCMKNNIEIINKIKYSKQDDSFTNHNQEAIFKQKYFSNRNNNTNLNSDSSFNQQPQTQFGTGQFKQQLNKSKEQSSLNSINRKQYSNKQSSPIMINQQVFVNKSSSMISRDVSQDNSSQSKQRKRDKSKEPKTNKKPKATSEKWLCDICENYNQANVYRCFSCKTMNTFQRDLLNGIIIHKEKSPNVQYRNKQPIKTNKSKLYSQTESSSTIKLNTRQLSLENIKPDYGYDYNCNINKLKSNSIKAKGADSTRLISTPNKISQTGKMTNAQFISNRNANASFSRPKTSMTKNKKHLFT